jgi:hypothetical protein
MAALSISRAWEETKARIATDGRLITIVAAALLAFPALISGVVSPGTSEGSEQTAGEAVVILIAALVAVVGQLAIIRLAVTPAVSVGEAIGHGARRMPIYVVSAVLILLGLLIAAIPFVVVAAAAGIPLDAESIKTSAAAELIVLLYVALVCFVAIRMLLSSAVASEENAGPVEIIRRSWALTAGHWWRLFGFLILFFIGAIVAMSAVSWATGFVAVMWFGPIAPLSASALIVAIVDAIVNATITVFLAVMLARIYLQLAGRTAAGASVPKSGI